MSKFTFLLHLLKTEKLKILKNANKKKTSNGHKDANEPKRFRLGVNHQKDIFLRLLWAYCPNVTNVLPDKTKNIVKHCGSTF